MLVALARSTRAEALSRELLERAAGDPRTEHFAYHFLADCALIRGDTREAEERYRQSLRAALPLGDVIETSFEVQGVAMAAAGSGDPTRALRLAGVGRGTLGVARHLDLGRVLGCAPRAVHRRGARAELGEEADAVWAEGRALPFDDAVQLATATTATPGSS